MIKRLQINNFRNYQDTRLSLSFEDRIVVLYGKNGSGKTNILEAISLLFESNGLRKSKYEDMVNRSTDKKYWNIILETEDTVFSSGYISNGTSGKRIYKVNDKIVKNLDEFKKENYILWMTYETDRLFMQSPSDRRAFIDMFCNVRSKDHDQNIKNYEKLTRERLKILKKYCENGVTSDISKWLDIIEEKIVDLGIKIAMERMYMTSELEKHQLSNDEFPKFKNKMNGKLENEILSQNPKDQTELYKIELKNRRQKDGFSGSTTLGSNRSDWVVFHQEKQINAEHCSAGEQKMLLSGIFLAFVVQNLKQDNRNLTLLLDDVIAHLDLPHKTLLFKYIKNFVKDKSRNIAVWLSGTQKNLFDELCEDAVFFNVVNGNII